ncbi:succinate dehydrogenase, cytochrome b556 subunit [Candidatus Mesenet endosymbiont of Agriotes lineatus]|uniref:succinate dehydrogenase, cytochrome b556 subunit n=1 Tax=Candidatus Mesenet endosymbiont of Agriotes lineatus TaxID=3077948 RepID=UPI0030CEBA7B
MVRPLSPYLQVLRKMQITSLLSISHRVSGVFLFFGVLFYSWCFALYVFFTDFVIAFSSRQCFILINKAFTFLFLSSFTYHFFNGIRHLLWDFGINLTNKGVSITGVIVVVLFLLSTLSLAFLVFY